MYLCRHKSKNPQIIRWSNLLSEFNCEIVHRAGEKIPHVDAMSRTPVESNEDQEDLEERVYKA